ncbi:hypothetical protein DINM_004357 [Dirofilaria immitis]|nr:hypothetical protein [Dirofilaria immitis]
MVYPLMRMDHARRKKYAMVACFFHAISAFLIFTSEANHFLVLPILTQTITQFIIHHESVSYLVNFAPFVTALLQLLMFAIHIYSIIAFAEQRQAYSRWNPQYLKRMVGFSTKQTDRNKINWVQKFFECCGVFGYEDWLFLTASNNLLESNLVINKYQWSHCTRNGCYLPHSCCKSNQLKCSPLILLQNFTKMKKLANVEPKNGCLDEIKRRLTIILLVAFSIINFVIQCIALVYSQITCTSYYMVSHCDAQDSAAILPAWILPFPPPYPQTIVKKCQELLKQGHGYRELVT